MGLLDTIFGSSEPKVDERKFEQILNRSGMNVKEKQEVDQIFKGHISEEGYKERGLDGNEARQALEFLKKGKEQRLHNIPDHKIEKFENQLKDRFRWKDEPNP